VLAAMFAANSLAQAPAWDGGPWSFGQAEPT
jgi:hypothetical protein